MQNNNISELDQIKAAKEICVMFMSISPRDPLDKIKYELIKSMVRGLTYLVESFSDDIKKMFVEGSDFNEGEESAVSALMALTHSHVKEEKQDVTA